MKRKVKPGKVSLSKRPNNQKLIETFLLLNQAKTEGKINDNKLNTTNELDKKVKNIKNKTNEKSEEEKSEDNIEKAEIDFIQRQNELRLINRGMFFEQDNKKLIEEVKNTNPELYKRLTVGEEMIFPIMIDTNLGVYKELISTQIEEIFKKIIKDSNQTWVEVLPIIDVSIVKLKIRDPDNENNFIILGFITKAISYQIYLLSLNNIISIKIYAHKNGRRLAIFLGLNYLKYSIKVEVK